MKKRIFISYSHEDEKWKDLLLTQLKVLDQHLDVWEDRRLKAGQDWFDEIKKAINTADAAILLISANFLTSGFIRKEEIPDLFRRRKEEKMPVFPLIIRPCAWQQLKWLNSILARPEDGTPLAGRRTHKVDEILSEFAVEIKTLLEKAPPRETHHIFLSKLPAGGRVFLGREKELAMLDNAWEDPHPHVLTLVAWGGVGKTALVNRWLNGMGREKFRGAARVYGWSFYSQGASVDRQTSADAFIDHALRWFGDPDPTTGSAWDKGTRLANRVRETKTLLVLDGLEPLQHPPGAMQGQLKDPALEALLKGLARSQPGLCVVTTRVRVEGIEFGADSPVRQECLDRLSPGTGAALLKEHGINGTEAELEAVSTEFKGHALALNLLGRYLAVVHKGDIRKKDRVPRLTDEEKEGGHAKRVMASYENHLSGKPELSVLYMLGLFDRPADAGAVNALRAEPSIEGLTADLQGLSDAEWRYALTHLRELNLLAVEEVGGQDVLDSHPLVREYFGERFQGNRPESFKEAHGRLYEYYKGLPKEEHPETLREMEPLFIAVFHGCRAGRHQEAMDDVFWSRIRRGNDAYSLRKLGAFGSQLSALSGFFAVPWSRPSPGLTEGDQAFILNEAAVCLRALGRLREAAQPMEAGLELFIKNEVWKQAAGMASNLSELCLTLGEVSRAVEWARKSVALADKSGDAFQMYSKRTTLADALHQSCAVGSDEVAEALTLFREAEERQKKDTPEYPFLFSQGGYRYCDLLLGGQEPGRYREVQKRAEKALEIVLAGSRNLLDIALNNLSLGRAHWLQALDEGPSDFTVPLAVLDRAVDGLREAGRNDYMPRALFARAAVYRGMKSFSRAREDLEEAREIAERGSMGLHMADYHLESARLCRDMGDTETAKTHRETAKTLIAQMAYHRRDPEITELEAAFRLL